MNPGTDTFNLDFFAKDFAGHLRQINMDLSKIKSLPKDQRNKVVDFLIQEKFGSKE